jgi:hypothetical protein
MIVEKPEENLWKKKDNQKREEKCQKRSKSCEEKRYIKHIEHSISIHLVLWCYVVGMFCVCGEISELQKK